MSAPTTTALIPQVWVLEARAAELNRSIAVLAGMAEDPTVPERTRTAARACGLAMQALVTSIETELEQVRVTAAALDDPRGEDSTDA